MPSRCRAVACSEASSRPARSTCRRLSEAGGGFMRHDRRPLLVSAAALLLSLALGGAVAAQEQPNVGLDAEREAELSHTHDGFYGALAPQNLHKKRPKAPVDFTGVWFINLRHAFSDFMFGPP